MTETDILEESFVFSVFAVFALLGYWNGAFSFELSLLCLLALALAAITNQLKTIISEISE